MLHTGTETRHSFASMPEKCQSSYPPPPFKHLENRSRIKEITSGFRFRSENNFEAKPTYRKVSPVKKHGSFNCVPLRRALDSALCPESAKGDAQAQTDLNYTGSKVNERGDQAWDVSRTIQQFPIEVLAKRGRLTVEANEPFFIVSIDGPGTALLGKSSSAVVGRMVKSVNWDSDRSNQMYEAAKLTRRNPSSKTFLTLPRQGKPTLMVAFQPSPHLVGDGRLEILLFPMPADCDLDLAEPVVEIDRDPSPASRGEHRTDERDSPDLCLWISDEEVCELEGDEREFDYVAEISVDCEGYCSS
mmetsp:Transcript_13871/g.47949  ORF Transcript_13871/g.47949 Transcript_13871/m.47949 type:complete len:302 (+) Transcript_13871:334-1239(+)